MPAEIIGREEEVAALAAFLDEAPGSHAALLIEGDAGIGKTTLWRAGIAEARRRGFDVLLAAPGEAESALAFAGLADLVEPVVASALERLPAPQRRALRVALLLDEPEGGPPDPRAIASGVRGALCSLAAERPVLVAIDDLQWLDPSSSAALAFVARRVREESIRFLLAQRAGHRDPTSAFAHTSRIDLGPLSLGAVRRILEQRLGRGYARPVIRRLHDASRGNPFYALEVARLIDPDIDLAPRDPLPVPSQVADVLQARLRALPGDTIEALNAAAALAHPTLEQLEAAVGPGVRSRLGAALEAGVLELERNRVRFAHPLYPDSVLAALTEHERRALHRRLASIVGELEQRARHLALASERPDEAVAATLERAASAASARGAPAVAAEFAEEALRLTRSSDDAYGRRTLVSAEYHHAGGQTQRARQLVEALVAREQAGHRRAVALERLARIVDVPATSIPLLQQARDEAGDDVALKIIIDQGLAGQAGVAWRDLPGVAAHLRRALPLAEELGDPAILAQVLAAVVYVETFLGFGLDRAAIDRAVALSEGVDEIPLANHPRWTKASVLDFGDEILESRSLLEELCAEAAARGDEPALAMFLHESSWVAWRAGDWRAALRQAEEADELAELAELATLRAYTLARRTWAYAHLGRVADTRAVAAEGLAHAHDIEALLPEYDMRHALGLLALSLGDAYEAERQLNPLVKAIWGAGIREPGFMRGLPDEVEALIALDEIERAVELLEPFEREAKRLHRAWALAATARCHAIVAAADGQLAEAERSFDESLRQHDRLGEPFDRARTLLALGVVQRRAKKRRTARDTLQGALAIFEELGAAIWAERARSELARIGGRAPASDELTPMERRVAVLVAAGRSNREIAAELVVALRTVETHLSRIYRKLGLRSRTQLAARVTEESLAAK